MIFTNIYQHIKEEKHLYFHFWANCMLIKGFQKGILFDMQRERTIMLSKLFCDTFEKLKKYPICTIAKNKTFENRDGYIKMLNYFITHNFGILTDDNSTLPELSLEYDSPFLATNVIIESESNKNPDFLFQTIEKIVNSQVQAIQINDHGRIRLSHLKKISEITINSQLQYITCYTNYSNPYSSKLISVLHNNNRFRNLIFMNAKTPKNYINNEFGIANVHYVKNTINFKNCGNVKNELFVYNQPFFIESQCHNTCLNRKVCIDAEGNIKNCPAMTKSYGNIKDTTLEEAINMPGFKDLWYINKDKIDVCKDCEFRYMCTDCRAFIKDSDNIYSQPAKCTYNPYICKWQGESGYVPVEECGTYSRETGFVPDKKKIKAMNKKILGED